MYKENEILHLKEIFNSNLDYNRLDKKMNNT